MTIYKVYDEFWGEQSNIRYYLKEESALKDYNSRENLLSKYMDYEEVIEE